MNQADVLREHPPVRAVSIRTRFPQGGQGARKKFDAAQCPSCGEWWPGRWSYCFYSESGKQYFPCPRCADLYYWPHLRGTSEGSYYYSVKGRECRMSHAEVLRRMAGNSEDETTRKHLNRQAAIWEETL